MSWQTPPPMIQKAEITSSKIELPVLDPCDEGFPFRMSEGQRRAVHVLGVPNINGIFLDADCNTGLNR